MRVGEYLLGCRVEDVLLDTPHAWMARVRGPDGDRVAKVRTPEAPSELHDALRLEHRILDRVHDPNVVALHGWESVPDGWSVLLLEYVPGGALSDRMFDGEPMAPEVAAHLMRGVLSGLEAIHQAGFVHRDLKPEHILLDDESEPHICDLGFAKELPKGGRERAGLSQFYSFLGTPEYMAPEQAAEPASADRRADLFSAGCILYELVTGHVPFEAPDDMPLLVPKILGRWERPAGLPSWVVPALEALLAPSPGDRPATATEALKLL
ncbi:MAG: serine/threonine-protein kinase [Myxococcota bacterium]